MTTMVFNTPHNLVVETHGNQVLLGAWLPCPGDDDLRVTPQAELSRCRWAYARVVAGTKGGLDHVYDTELASLYSDWLSLDLEVAE